MYFNRTIILLCCMLACSIISAQKNQSKVKFGDIKPEDFKPEYYEIDSSADAVYLYDIGSSKHVGNNNGSFSVEYAIHERIRLMHKKSFDDLATVKINLSKSGDDVEKINNLQAATYNIADGKVVETKVDKNSIFRDKDGDDQVVKFTFPDLKEGCIIEYAYTIIIPHYSYIPSWTFQGSYPRLWSEFAIEVPQFFDFVIMKHGFLDAAIDTGIASSNMFSVLDPNGSSSSQVYNFKSNTIKHTWAYKNVPPLKKEMYIANLSSYIQSVEFQFSAIRYPEQEPKFYMHSWPETVDDLMKDEDFGLELTKEKGWLKDEVKAAVNGETESLKIAKNIYDYVRDNYNCIDYSAMYLSQPLKKTQQLKKGNVADINLLLTAMLRVAGYAADPVLLSTRGHGKTYDMYPIMNKFNYVITRVSITGNEYLLDAADPVLGFGNLSNDCYNGNARVIASLPSLISLDADSLRETQTTTLFLANGEKGKIEGAYNCIFGQAESEDLREQMKKSNTNDYFKNIKKAYSFEVNMSNTTIDSLHKMEMPVAVKYDIDFSVDDDIIYFSPMMAADVNKKNPFSAAQRYYPVEMPYCLDNNYVLNMEVPAGYKVDELPKSTRVSLNDNEGMFEYLVQQSGDHIQMRCRTKLNKATFEPEDYETLRNFFAFIVEKQNEQIVFKKM